LRGDFRSASGATNARVKLGLPPAARAAEPNDEAPLVSPKGNRTETELRHLGRD
jgi:hypothetical protein